MDFAMGYADQQPLTISDLNPDSNPNTNRKGAS